MGIIQCLKVKGAKIIVSEVAKQRQTFAKEFGAAHVLDPKTDDVVKRVKELCGGVGPKVAFDCAGEYSDVFAEPQSEICDCYVLTAIQEYHLALVPLLCRFVLVDQ